MTAIGVLAVLFVIALTAEAEDKEIRVFIALCDNKTQGIIPVSPKIGNGDDPDSNLYWGCDEGFGSVFRHSKNWKVLKCRSDVSQEVLRRMKLRHVEGGLTMTADAYRGSEIRKCIEDFEAAVASGQFALVAYIGHDGLMDFQLPEPAAHAATGTDAIVLACVSNRYFADRLRRLGARPILMTEQLMYPGAFILRDVLEVWRKGGGLEEIRSAAATAYAGNQHISTRAALGIFTDATR